MSQEIDMTNDVQPTSGAFTLTKQDNGIAILTMDVPGESMNTLKAEFGDEISSMLDDIKSKTNFSEMLSAIFGPPNTHIKNKGQAIDLKIF